MKTTQVPKIRLQKRVGTRIDVQAEINVQVEKFLKNIKRAGQNRRAGGKIFSKSINVQTKIRLCREEFFLKINKRADQSKAVHIGWNRHAGGIFSQNQ